MKNLLRPLLLALPVLVLSSASLAAQQHDHAPAGKAPTTKAAPAKVVVPDYDSQTLCPISGEELEDKKSFVDYEGQRVYLCSKKCVKKFKAFPDKWIAAMAQENQAPVNIQTHCPVSGEELEDDAKVVWVGNKSIKVCCKKCVAKVSKNPAAFLDKLEGRKAQTVCAVMGGKIIPQNTFVVQGTLVDQCCPGCENKWSADPAKYFGKLASEKILLMPASETCAVNPKKPAKALHFVTFGSRRFNFCCDQCRGKFIANPKKYLDAMPTVARTAMPAKTEHAAPSEAKEHHVGGKK